MLEPKNKMSAEAVTDMLQQLELRKSKREAASAKAASANGAFIPLPRSRSPSPVDVHTAQRQQERTRSSFRKKVGVGLALGLGAAAAAGHSYSRPTPVHPIPPHAYKLFFQDDPRVKQMDRDWRNKVFVKKHGRPPTSDSDFDQIYVDDWRKVPPLEDKGSEYDSWRGHQPTHLPAEFWSENVLSRMGLQTNEPKGQKQTPEATAAEATAAEARAAAIAKIRENMTKFRYKLYSRRDFKDKHGRWPTAAESLAEKYRLEDLFEKKHGRLPTKEELYREWQEEQAFRDGGTRRTRRSQNRRTRRGGRRNRRTGRGRR